MDHCWQGAADFSQEHVHAHKMDPWSTLTPRLDWWQLISSEETDIKLTSTGDCCNWESSEFRWPELINADTPVYEAPRFNLGAAGVDFLGEVAANSNNGANGNTARVRCRRCQNTTRVYQQSSWSFCKYSVWITYIFPAGFLRLMYVSLK